MHLGIVVGGKSCTLIGENKRHLMKDVIKDSEKKAENDSKDKVPGAMIRTRTVPSAVITHFVTKIQSLEDHVKEVLQAEAVAKMDRIAEMELTKAKNLIEHHDEIHTRPQREWYKSVEKKRLTKAEMAEKAKMIAEKAGTGMHNMTRKKRRKREAMQALKEELGHSQNHEEDNNPMNATAVKKLKMATPSAVKASARKEKREKIKEKLASDQRSIYEEDQRMEQKDAKRTKKKRLGIEAIGDSNLFDDEQYTYATNPTKQKKNMDSSSDPNNEGDNDGTPNSFYNFRGFDPNQKQRKHKKKGHNAFKSKSKYRRRK
jgi:ATP-dependent RNA helicase DDX27